MRNLRKKKIGFSDKVIDVIKNNLELTITNNDSSYITIELKLWDKALNKMVMFNCDTRDFEQLSGHWQD